MSNKIFALLLICCLTYSAYTACHADCGGDTDGTHCVTGESGADKCMTCDSGSILVIATTADLFGTCKTGIAAACPDNKFAYYETNPASPLPFCGTASQASTTCVLCGAATSCATFAYDSVTDGTDVAFTANTEDTDKCKTCQTPSGKSILAAAGKDFGTCLADSANTACAPNTKAKVYTTGQTIIYHCMSPAEIVADSGNVRGKVDCTTHVTTALDSNIFADVNDFLDDCTACATDNQMLVITAADVQFGYCVPNTATVSPCTTVTHFVLKTAATHSNLATYCLTNAAANDKCGVCTDLAAASNKCNLFKYTGLAIADEATALTQCKSCVTTTDFIHLSGTGVLYGTCIANTATATKAACGDNNYAIFETNPASPLTYCGSASTASSKCIICKAATKCKVFSYYDGVASTATAQAAWAATTTTEPDQCTECKTGQGVPLLAAADGVGAPCTAWGSVSCGTDKRVLTVSTTMGFCTTIVDGSAGLFTPKLCKTWPAQTALYADNAAALAACSECNANQNLIGTADQSGTGSCADNTVNMNGYCASGKYLITYTAPAAGGVDGRPTWCQTNTCTFCATSSSDCNTFFYGSAIGSTASESNSYIFSSAATAEAHCKTCGNSKNVLAAAEGDKAGTCTTFAAGTCSGSKEAIIGPSSASVYWCKAPAQDSTSKKAPCTTYDQPAVAKATDAAALDACTVCVAATEVLVVTNMVNTVGACVPLADLDTHCGANKYLDGTDSTKGKCETQTTASIGGSTAQLCGSFYYVEAAKTYNGNAASLGGCLSCSSTAHVSIGSASNSVSGHCRLVNDINTICGIHKYLQAISSSDTFGYCETSTDAGLYSACEQYYYSSTATFKRTYQSAADANDNCIVCDEDKVMVFQDNTVTTGRCVINPWLPNQPCDATYAVRQKVNQLGTAVAQKAYCHQPSDGSNGQLKCYAYYYGTENQYFPVATTNYIDWCHMCDSDTNQIHLRGVGERFGKCFDTTVNAVATCTSALSKQGWYLRKGTSKFEYADDVAYSYCQPAATPSAPFQKCLTYYYTNGNLDQDAIAANDYCVTCAADQILIVDNILNKYGKCANSVVGACGSGKYIKKIADVGSQTAGICEQTTVTGTQVYCQAYYYNTNLYIDDTAANAINMCTECAAGQFLLVDAFSYTIGQCQTKTPLTVSTAGYFLKLVAKKTASKGAVVRLVASTSCSTFNYNLNTDIDDRGYYIDIFEAEADCNACKTGFFKHIDAFKTCQSSPKCATFQQATYASLELAEKECQTCRSGQILIKATAEATFGVCQRSTTCNQFDKTSYLTLAAADLECKDCYEGWIKGAAEGATFGTCTASATCLQSSVDAVALTVTAFDADCNQCKEGYYLVAKADAAPRCIAIPSSANCLMVYPDVLTEATVAANCFVCKSGYYPKGELFVGTCTAMTLKHTCLEFSAGAAANEIDYGKKKCNKCPSEFYYYDGNNGCVRCPYPCKTCLPVKQSDSDIVQVNAFCTSCHEGAADLILYTNQHFGYCLACNNCNSCSGVYINTSPDFSNRKCEQCQNDKPYFVYDFQSESGTCDICSVAQPNCKRCSGHGLCYQCKIGFYLSPIEMQCVACKADCALCHDATTCDQSICIDNCDACTANTFAGCSKCMVGSYRSDSACVSCEAGCLECTSSSCTKRDPSVKGTTCATNCFACSGDAATPEQCTTPIWGYFKQSVTVEAVTTVTLEQCIFGCKTCTGRSFSECSECKTAFYKNDKGAACDLCHSSCTSCTGPTMNECLECNNKSEMPEFVLQVFQGKTFGSCQPCDFFTCKTCGGKAPAPFMACSSCWGSNVVLLHYEGPLGKSGECVPSCPADTFNDGGFCRRCILGSPSPCPQPPAAAAAYASFLTFPLIIIALIFMIL